MFRRNLVEMAVAHPLPHRPSMAREIHQVAAALHTLTSSAGQSDGLIRRIRAEYLEMPGLHLSAAQAQRLWSLDAETCMSVLEALLVDRFLARTPSGHYRRFDVA